jgi:hypothetical protein
MNHLMIALFELIFGLLVSFWKMLNLLWVPLAVVVCACVCVCARPPPSSPHARKLSSAWIAPGGVWSVGRASWGCSLSISSLVPTVQHLRLFSNTNIAASLIVLFYWLRYLSLCSDWLWGRCSIPSRVTSTWFPDRFWGRPTLLSIGYWCVMLRGVKRTA